MPPTKRRKVERENSEYAAMLRRLIRSYGRRVGETDDTDLAEMVALRDTLEEAIEAAVHAQRAQRIPASWADIARGLGTTRQYAQRRYGRTTTTTTTEENVA